MRHALVPVHLMNSARTAAARWDAEPDDPEVWARSTRRARRAHRLATRSRRLRA